MPDSWLPEFKSAYTELISGWYARVDMGYRWNKIGSVDNAAGLTSWTYDNSWSIGGGGGYKYQWFRTDITADYGQRANFSGNTAAQANFYQNRLDTVTLLWNFYLDLGTWSGFTPYVGAGIGTSFLRTVQFTTPVWQGVKDNTQWDLSWAAMAGIAFRLSETILLDVNYRYLSLGDATTGTLPPTYTSRITYRDITAQEVRLGLRLVLD